FGVVVLEMLTGRGPVEGDTPHWLQPRAELEGLVETTWGHVLARCCARDPQERPATVDEVVAELRAARPQPAAPGAVHAGDRLGRYALLDEIARSGSDARFRARDIDLGRDVSLRVLTPESSERMRRFEREVRAAGAVSHPNLAAVHELGEHQGVRFLVSEL